MTLGRGHDTSSGHGQQLSEILFRSNKTVESYGPDTDFPSLEIVQTIGCLRKAPQSDRTRTAELYGDSRLSGRFRDYDFPCVHCDLDLGYMTLGHDHDPRVCKILSESKFTVEIYGPDKHYGYASRMTSNSGHGQQLYEILLSTFMLTVVSYDPGKELSYMCNKTLTLDT